MIMTVLYLSLVSVGAFIGIGIGYGLGHAAGTANGFRLARIAQDNQKAFWDKYAADQVRRMKSATR